MRKLPDGSKAKAGNVQLMRMAGRATRRLLADLAADIFQRIDEVQRNRLSCLGQIVLDRLVDVAPHPLAKDYRLAAPLRPASRTRPRSRSK